MDDHMLDRIQSEIELCFDCAAREAGEKAEETSDYKAAAALIKAYNALVKLYYKAEYQKEYLLGSVAQEYERYMQ